MAKSLIELQQDAIDSIMAARTQGRRAASHGMTTLNKSPRVLHRIRKEYKKAVERLGFSDSQIEQQWRDVRDMAILEDAAE